MPRRRRSRSLRFAAPLALAAIAFAPSATAAGVTPSAATPVQREQAQSRFLRGKELYGARKFDAALAEFTASLDIVASPNTRLYVGRCLREMGRYVPAYVELGRTAIEAKELTRDDPRYEKAAAAAAEERKALEPKLGFIDITVSHAAPTTTLRVAGDDVRRGGWSEPVPVMPGTAEVVVETPGHAPVKRSVQVAAGSRQSLALDAAADTPDVAVVATNKDAPDEGSTSKRKDLRPYAYVAGGVAVAGLATFTVFGLLSNGTHSDLEAACGPRPCPPGHEDEISRGKTQQTIANIGLVIGAIGAAAAVTLFVVGKPPAQATTTAASARVVARGSFLGLEGSF
jgi:hypothetical protein